VICPIKVSPNVSVTTVTVYQRTLVVAGVEPFKHVKLVGRDTPIPEVKGINGMLALQNIDPD